MNHFILFIICVVLIEIVIRLNLFKLIYSFLQVLRKVMIIIPNSKISDHWKEKVVLAYAIKIMEFTLKIFFITILFLLIIFLTVKLNSGFYDFIFSFLAFIESIVFGIIYFYLRKLTYKNE